MSPSVTSRAVKTVLPIASAPGEDTLMVATRMRDTAFKRVLKTMSIGGPVTIEGPSGELTTGY